MTDKSPAQPSAGALTAERFYHDVWIKFNGSDPCGDWPIRFAKQFAEAYATETNRKLLEALERIRDRAEPCGCDHTTEDCCALQHPLDFVCPYCIADIAIADARKP